MQNSHFYFFQFWQIFRIGTVRYAEGLWRMRRHGPHIRVMAHCRRTDSEHQFSSTRAHERSSNIEVLEYSEHPYCLAATRHNAAARHVNLPITWLMISRRTSDIFVGVSRYMTLQHCISYTLRTKILSFSFKYNYLRFTFM